MADLSEEINAMNEVGTEAPSTESPGTDAPGTESPSTDAPTTEAPSEPELDRFAELQAKIDELNAKLEAKAKPVTQAPSTDAPIDLQDFLSDVDSDEVYEILSDKEKLNKLLNKVYTEGVKASRSQTSESVFRKIPDIVRNNVETYITLVEASKDFYDKNPDLKPYAKKVAETYETMAATSPDKSVSDVFNTLGDEVRKQLKLQKKATATKPELPPGTKGKKGTQSKPELSGILAEIEAMNQLED